jgi:protein-disulfide isomerase
MTEELTLVVSDDDHVLGPADASVTLVEYGDFECSYCGQAYSIVKAIQERLGNQLRFVFRNFPLSEAHPHAERAAEVAEAAGAQGKFWEMHDLLYERQQALEEADLVRYAKELGLDTERVVHELETGAWAPRVRADFRSGVRTGVNGTPTFFIDGERFDGDWTDERQLERALSESAQGSKTRIPR